MDLKAQKQLAAKVLKCSPKRVTFNTEKLSTIKEALTRADIRDLVNSNVISRKQKQESSKVRARKIAKQKAKGLQKGLGSRKGTAKVRLNEKEAWMNKVRLQRSLITQLKENSRINAKTYRSLYNKVRGNFFRNRRHILTYLEDEKLFMGRDAK